MKNVWKSIGVPLVCLIAFAILGQTIEFSTNQYVQLVCLGALANIIYAISLNLVNGFTGQFSIGHAGFMAVGAYVSGYLSTEVVKSPGIFDFFWFAIAGGLAAALAGYVVGLPSLRLRGDYLAIVTLGFGEIIRVILINMPAVGGARGMGGIPRPPAMELGNFVLTPWYLYFLVAAFFVTLSFIVLWRLTHSVHGRAFLSVREDEIAAQAMGIDTTKVKVRAFVISSFFCGISGALFAHANQYLNPSTFTFNKSVDAIVMVVLGGLGSLTGSVMAALAITFLMELGLRSVTEMIGIDLRMVIYPLILILFMILRPQGIFGTKELPDLWRRNDDPK